MNVRQAVTKVMREQADRTDLIETCWQLFAAHIKVPPGGDQWIDMRRSFFAGALLLFDAQQMIMDEDREPTDADVARFDRIARELQRFGEDLAAGRA